MMENKHDTGYLEIKVSQCFGCKNQTIEKNYRKGCKIYEYVSEELKWGEIKCIYREEKEIIKKY